MIGVLGVVQSGIKVDAPASAPAGGLVAFQFKSARGSTVDSLLGVRTVVEMMARVDAKEVALMTMVWILVLPIIEPLLQVALMPNLIRMQTGEGGIDLGDEIAEHTAGITECKGSIAGIAEAFANHGDVGKATETGAPVIAIGGDKRVFRRGGWGGDEIVDG